MFSISTVSAAFAVDGFEDNDITNNPSWEASGTAIVVATAKTGSKGLNLTANTGTISKVRTKIVDRTGNDYNAWFQTENIDKNTSFSVLGTNDQNIATIFVESSHFLYLDDGNKVSFTTVPTNNNWYLLEILHDNNSNLASYYIYNSAGSLLESHQNKKVVNLTDSNQVELSLQSSTLVSCYWDDVVYSPLTLSGIRFPNLVEFKIKIPKDELTENKIFPYSIRTIDASNQEYQMLTTDYVVQWTKNTNKINIDINANGYFSRRYTYDSNTDINFLQPYLVSNVTGIQTIITVLGSITGSGVGDITIVSSKLINDIETEMESHVTDSSGRALFSFYPGDNYTLKYYQNEILRKTESFSATSTTYTTWLSIPFVFPQIVPAPYADLNFYPGIQSIYANDQNFLDLNQAIYPHYQNISKIDLNIYYNLDKNIWSDTNLDGIAIGTTGYFHEDINLNQPGFDFNSVIYIFVKITFADGNKQTFFKSYIPLLSQAMFDCNWNGTGKWNMDNTFACWQAWGKNIKENIPGQINVDGDANKTITSFLAVLLAFLVCIGLASSVGLDSSSSGFVFVVILGIAWFFGWIFDTLFFIAVFVLLAMIFFKLTMKSGW